MKNRYWASKIGGFKISVYDASGYNYALVSAIIEIFQFFLFAIKMCVCFVVFNEYNF
jgi:hypothetical protein